MKTIIETLREIRIRPTLLWAPPETTGDIAQSRTGRTYSVRNDGSLRRPDPRPKNGKRARRLRNMVRRLDREYGWVAPAPEVTP